MLFMRESLSFGFDPMKPRLYFASRPFQGRPYHTNGRSLENFKYFLQDFFVEIVAAKAETSLFGIVARSPADKVITSLCVGHHEGCAAEGATKESLGKRRAAAGPITAGELIFGQYGFNLLLLFGGQIGGMMVRVSNPALRGKL